jgi:hypothetical protein
MKKEDRKNRKLLKLKRRRKQNNKPKRNKMVPMA